MKWVGSLLLYLIEGKLVKRFNNSVYLDSSSVTKPVKIFSKEYQVLDKIVKETNSTIEEFIVTVIRDKIINYQNIQ
ncbi:hypothetical protein AXW78_28010 (plasmid) [Bacillus thuringiensis]|uniref:Uncharacterized protein n=1 Tax=Bacillus thuringiensis TaxID=1428 RepID=A0A9W3YKT3_BACTU|nr:hypothetical protein AXW78_28010 [Bacillus thuringiensis]AYF85338.1 hypothetical protein D7J84_30650 [Bacillus thuringiensis]PNK25806.1 hypothetical protein CBR55_32000 [Bacillus thuringiensis]